MFRGRKPQLEVCQRNQRQLRASSQLIYFDVCSAWACRGRAADSNCFKLDVLADARAISYGPKIAFVFCSADILWALHLGCPNYQVKLEVVHLHLGYGTLRDTHAHKCCLPGSIDPPNNILLSVSSPELQESSS